MIKVKVSVKDSTAKWQAFRQRMKKVHGSHVTVGVHEDAGSYEGGQSVAEVALWNEFGTTTIPERSFLRSAIDGAESQLNDWRKEFLDKIAHGEMTTEKALEALGFRVQTLVQNKIKSGDFKDNAPSTLREKRRQGVGSMPLQWSKLLLRSIGFKVNL